MALTVRVPRIKLRQQFRHGRRRGGTGTIAVCFLICGKQVTPTTTMSAFGQTRPDERYKKEQ
jgi:hypothetical protein